MIGIIIAGALSIVLNACLNFILKSGLSVPEVGAMILATFADSSLIWCLWGITRRLKNRLLRIIIGLVMAYVIIQLAMGWYVTLERIL